MMPESSDRIWMHCDHICFEQCPSRCLEYIEHWNRGLRDDILVHMRQRGDDANGCARPFVYGEHSIISRGGSRVAFVIANANFCDKMATCCDFIVWNGSSGPELSIRCENEPKSATNTNFITARCIIDAFCNCTHFGCFTSSFMFIW